MEASGKMPVQPGAILLKATAATITEAGVLGSCGEKVTSFGSHVASC